MALIDPTSGDTLKVVERGIAATDPAAAGSRVLLRLPHKVGLLPQAENSRIYNRLIQEEGEEVPVDEDGRLLNELTYLNLPSEQKGRIVYFGITGTNPEGEPVQEEVSDFQFGSLEDSLKGDVFYFRRLIGKGGEFPFDRAGNPLDRTAYNRLPAAERGSIVASGELVRVRFKARVILNGTTIDATVRDSNFPESWQQVDAGDATSLRESKTLSISVPVTSQVLQNVEIEPNPFTPNADSVNDEIQIRFVIGKLNVDRDIRIQIFDLGGPSGVAANPDRIRRTALCLEWTGRPGTDGSPGSLPVQDRGGRGQVFWHCGSNHSSGFLEETHSPLPLAPYVDAETLSLPEHAGSPGGPGVAGSYGRGIAVA